MSRACVIWWATAAEHIIKMTLLQESTTVIKSNKEPNHFIISVCSVRCGKLIRWKLFMKKTLRFEHTLERKYYFWIINDNNLFRVCASRCCFCWSVANTPCSSCELEKHMNIKLSYCGLENFMFQIFNETLRNKIRFSLCTQA